MTACEKSADTLLSVEAAATIRDEIAAAGGNEVFFVGTTDDERRVTAVTVAARGNAGEVPAFFHCVDAGDVVLHNHPGDDLTPSTADLHLAGAFGEMSVGFFITDNPAERIYVVVPPFERVERVALDTADLAGLFSADSVFADTLSGFEVRPQQAAMMAHVSGAFNDNKIHLIEAGTGIGKTLAYLVPAARWALANRERVIISTNTINLQEQLIHKDIPLLQRTFDKSLSAALLKGRTNYLCLRKLRRIEQHPELMLGESLSNELDSIVEWARSTDDGSRSDLPFSPSAATWSHVAAEPDFCLRAKCDHFRACFVQRARQAAVAANILVVNHHLLFADLAIRKQTGSFTSVAVLPPYTRLILDEAHNIEDVATSYLGKTVSRMGLAMTLGRLVGQRRRGRRGPAGLLVYLRARLGAASRANPREAEAVETFIENRVVPLVEECREAGTAFFDAVCEFMNDAVANKEGGEKLRIVSEVEETESFTTLRDGEAVPLARLLKRLSGQVYELARRSEMIVDDDDKNAQGDLAELKAIARRVAAVAAVVMEVFDGDGRQDNMVYWIETRRGPREPVSLNIAPLDIADELAEHFYPRVKTIVLTSATLSVGERFDYIEGRIGLDRMPADRYESLMLDSPFDYARQVMVGIPSDLPKPNDGRFVEEAAAATVQALQTTGGRAFVLFTSFGMLDAVYDRVAPVLAEHGISTLRQGSRPRHMLLDEFRRDVGSVLFGTDSFWAGVDVEGEALQCVIITRLPFRVPTEPIQVARAELIKTRGGNPFLEYTVPQAIIKFRQGFGRLIRRKTDRGAVLVFDTRILAKYYGRQFLRSMPPAQVVKGPCSDVMGQLGTFWKQHVAK